MNPFARSILCACAGIAAGAAFAQARPAPAATAKASAKATAKNSARIGASEGPASASGFRRFALVVGVNDGGAGRTRLRYAGTDASAFSDVMVELGGVARADLVLLRDPTRAAFLEAMETLRARIGSATDGGTRPELLVYFSGHSDETGLIFGKEKLTYADFRARIDAAPAKIRLAVVDACASGALTRLKGGSRLPAFSVDQSSNLSGYAFLTSSSGAESAQESDRIRASFFTHFLLTGLRGGADRNQDGKVTLGEAYEFAFQETLSQTEGTQAGAQHPSYDMRLTGTGDLVLTDLRGTSAGLVLDPKLRGRIFVRGASGALVAELQKQPGKRVELGLEPGNYDMSLDRGDSLFRALIQVDALTHRPVAQGDFEAVARESTRSRGGSDSSLSPSFLPEMVGPMAGDGTGSETPKGSPPSGAVSAPDAPWISARAALVPSMGFPGSGSGPWSHNLSVNLFSGNAATIHGAQLSLGSNNASRELHGVQFGLVNSTEGESRGAQIGLLANTVANDHRGAQVSLVVNNSRTITGAQVAPVNHAESGTGLQVGAINAAANHRGAQIGLLNAAGEQTGLQASAVNVALVQTGVQAGLLNYADTSRGLQVGLVNYATYGESAVLGLISIVGNGLHDVEATFDERSMLRTALVLGGKYNYNYLSFDMKARYPRHLWGGSAGVGIHVPGRHLFMDMDLGAGILFNDQDWDNYTGHLRARALTGVNFTRWFSLFGGVSLNAETWPTTRRPNLNPNREGEHWSDDAQGFVWPGFFLGVRL